MPNFRSLLEDADQASRNAIYAVIICTAAALTGILLGQVIEIFSHQGYLPMSTFLLTIYVLLGAGWLAMSRQRAFDPAATFVAFVSSVAVLNWIIQFFFVDAGIGPFGDELWTAQNIIGNAIFGTSLFMLIGATVGTTYWAARITSGPVSWRRTLIYTIAIGFPLAFIARAEYFFVALAG
jgi:uncharacterized membrane protein SirB2